MSYTVKFVDNEAFDSLPYKRVSSSIGVADRNSGIAYVRDTGNPMDIFTAYHELEHLKGDDLNEYESPGEDGIYYKTFGQILQDSIPGTKAFSQDVLGHGPEIGTALGTLFGGPVGGMVGNQVGGSVASRTGGRQNAMANPFNGQPTMDAFNPQVSMAQASPAVSEVGGAGGGNMGGGIGQGTIDKVRELLNQRQSGFYAGRDAGGA